MSFFKRVIRYCRLHLFRDPLYFILFVVHYFNPKYIPVISYFNAESIRDFLTSNKSIIRLGDGEIFILNGGSLPGQKFDKKLQEKLLTLITEYRSTSPYVLCLNKIPLAKSNRQLRSEGLIPCWLPSKVFINLYFPKNQSYLDAAMFYYGDTIPKYFEAHLLTKKLVLISNLANIERFKSNEHIPFKDIEYIETIGKDAFADYEEIKAKAYSLVEKNKPHETVILAAFGPASKVLAYDFSKEGIQVIDIGQGIEVAYSHEKLYPGLETLK